MSVRTAARALLCAALALASAALLPPPSSCQTRFTGDGQVTGQMGVGTSVPQARLEVKISSTDAYGLKVSSADGSAFLVVDSSGRLGVKLSTPLANVDVVGGADSGELGLLLRVGNSSASTASGQIAFAYGNSTQTFRHSIRTRHRASQNLHNAVDFFLWRSTGQPEALGGLWAMSLQNVPAASTGSVHVLPTGDADAELEVSNSTTTGGGTIHRASAGTHSSAALKGGIEHLTEGDERTAFEDVRALRLTRFRYRNDPSGRPMRGLLYEEAPESVRGPHKTVVVDYRLLNLEAALKEVNRRVLALEAEIAALEGRR